MRFLCLCPTYKKPWNLIEQSIDCFNKQTHKNSFLLIYDDLGQFVEQSGRNWHLISTNVREPDMISKYDKMIELSKRFGDFEAIAIWDDDDIYLPNHLSFHNIILENFEFSYPSFIWDSFNAAIKEGGKSKESTDGRYWASCSIRMDSFKKYEGFVKHKLKDFDFVNLHRWIKLCSVGDPCSLGEPTFLHRWETTGCWHASWSVFSGGEDEEKWYESIAQY